MLIEHNVGIDEQVHKQDVSIPFGYLAYSIVHALIPCMDS